VNCEVTLEPGVYEIIPKIIAERDEQCMPVEEMVRIAAHTNPDKLRQVGKQFDLAHAKAGAIEAQKACHGVESLTSGLSAPSEIRDRSITDASGSRLERESDTDSDSEAECDNGSSENQPWNAVCIIGLRILSQGAGISITDSGDL
jgi:hypothetical protein